MLGIKNISSSFQRGMKNASYMGAGTFLSQIIGFVGFLFIARMLGVERFGVYNTVFAFVTFFHLFTLAGLQKIIVREGSKDIHSFSNVLDQTIGLKIFFTFSAFLLCILATFFTHYPPFTKVLIIIFSTEIIYFGLDSFLSAVFQTHEKMQYLALFQILIRSITTVFSILFLYLGAGVTFILLLNLIVKIGVLVYGYFISRRLSPFRFHLNIQFDSEILRGALIFSLMGFVNTLAIKIDVLMVSFLSTEADVGIYSAAHELGREGLIFRNILATAFFPIAVKLFTSKQVRIKTLFTYSLGLFVIVFAGAVVVFFFAEDLVVLLFRDEYRYSGFILKYLVFYLPFAFLTLPMTICLQATHNEQKVLFAMLIAALANIPLNLIFYYKFGLIGIAYSTIVVFICLAFFITFFTVSTMRKQGFLI
ncbi:MAG: flippase [Acidobacteriota bacterium]